jgi:hypothetical protein
MLQKREGLLFNSIYSSYTHVFVKEEADFGLGIGRNQSLNLLIKKRIKWLADD